MAKKKSLFEDLNKKILGLKGSFRVPGNVSSQPRAQVIYLHNPSNSLNNLNDLYHASNTVFKLKEKKSEGLIGSLISAQAHSMAEAWKYIEAMGLNVGVTTRVVIDSHREREAAIEAFKVVMGHDVEPSDAYTLRALRPGIQIRITNEGSSFTAAKIQEEMMKRWYEIGGGVEFKRVFPPDKTKG